MKIAIIGENYYPTVGGIQEHMYNQARCLRDEGHDAYIITGIPQVDSWNGPPDDRFVLRVGKAVRYGVMGTVTNFTCGPRATYNLKKIFELHNFDLIHLHNPGDFGLPLLAYCMFKGKKIATLHSAFRHSCSKTLISPYYRRILRQTNKLIAVSELAAASMRRYADFAYEIIPNGVDVKKFSQGVPLAKYADGRKTILFLGRFERRNGLDKLLRAVPQIVGQYPDCRLLVAGSARDGSTSAYEQLVADPYKKNVHFLGRVQDHERANLYASADVFVLPARFGGSFSIMVLEALAAGTPIVSTPFVTSEYRGNHWQTVHLCNDYSPASISAMINHVLGRDNGGDIAKGKKIVAEYDWKIITKKLLTAYSQVL